MIDVDTSTPIACELARNRYMADFSATNQHVSDDMLRIVLEALVDGGDRYERLGQLQEDDQQDLRLLAIPTVLAELQRRMEVRELES